MSAVTLLAWMSMLTSDDGLEGAVERREVLDLHAQGGSLAGGRAVVPLPHFALVL